MPRSLLALAAALVAFSPSPSHAQSVSSAVELQPGAKVRIVAPGIVAGRYVGTVLARTDDTLTLGSQNALPIKVAASKIQSLEISHGKSRGDGAIRGMIWGTPIGLVLGLLLMDADEGCPRCQPPQGPTSDAAALATGAVAGILWGAGIGALVGRERWDDFDLQHRTALELAPGRASFALRYQF
jgi:hypothetical protein